MIPEYFVMDVSGRGVHRIILRAEGGGGRTPGRLKFVGDTKRKMKQIE